MTWRRWVKMREAWVTNPPAHMILAAVHMDRKKKRGEATREPIEQPVTQHWDWDSLGPIKSA